MTDNLEEDREAPATTTDQPPPTGWRAALIPTAEPDNIGDDAEAHEDDSAEAADPGSDGDADGADEDAAARPAIVPEDANGYVLPEIEGHQWSEADAPVLESFFSHAHATGMPQESVN